jgi:hypothetical protein
LRGGVLRGVAGSVQDPNEVRAQLLGFIQEIHWVVARVAGRQPPQDTTVHEALAHVDFRVLRIR